MLSVFQLKSKDPQRYACFVLWDAATESYMVYVCRTMKQEKGYIVIGEDGFKYDGNVVLLRGTSHKEIQTVEEAARILGPFADIPKDLYKPLLELKARTTGEELAASTSTSEGHH